MQWCDPWFNYPPPFQRNFKFTRQCHSFLDKRGVSTYQNQTPTNKLVSIGGRNLTISELSQTKIVRPLSKIGEDVGFGIGFVEAKLFSASSLAEARITLRTCFTFVPRFSDVWLWQALVATLVCTNGLAISRSSLWPFPASCLCFFRSFKIFDGVI